MDVRNCRQCGKLYNYIGGSYRNLCPSCIKQLEDKFMEIKEYIRDNKVNMLGMPLPNEEKMKPIDFR